MNRDDRHPGAVLIEVKVVEDELGLVRIDELHQLAYGRLEFLHLSLTDLGAVDVHDRLGHGAPFVAGAQHFFAARHFSGSVSSTDEVYERCESKTSGICAAQPDPEQLAERLFRYEMALPFETFLDSARVYRKALGITGLQRFRELATAEWDKVKPKGAEEGITASYDSGRWRITRIRETLAEISGDIEELVAIKSRDLSSAYRFLDIAEIYLKAGQAEQALAWAERGLQAFPERPDNRLRDFLVALYLERGRNEEALHLTWIQLEQQPALEYYKKLSAVATRLQCWPQQRQRALQRIDAAILQTAATSSQWHPKSSTPDQSLRVEVALWEKDFDAAWHAIHQGNCRQELLIALADYLAALRLQYKPKRNFIKLLDGVSSAALAGSQVFTKASK